MKKLKKAPESEQNICISCGFCCDGTLFLNAILKPGEKGSLPEKIEENVFSTDNDDFFKLPCLYFSHKCTIYKQSKAIVCSAYRCQLLKDYSRKKINKKEAVELVGKAKEFRESIFRHYSLLSGNKEFVHFKKLLQELWEKKSTLSAEEENDYKMIIVQCNIFETLLIKHFRSAKDYENMIADE